MNLEGMEEDERESANLSEQMQTSEFFPPPVSVAGKKINHP